LVGEFFDFIWAPISALLIYLLFRKPAFAGIALIEEILPGFDFIPTATMAWLFWMLEGVDENIDALDAQRMKSRAPVS